MPIDTINSATTPPITTTAQATTAASSTPAATPTPTASTSSIDQMQTSTPSIPTKLQPAMTTTPRVSFGRAVGEIAQAPGEGAALELLSVLFIRQSARDVATNISGGVVRGVFSIPEKVTSTAAVVAIAPTRALFAIATDPRRSLAARIFAGIGTALTAPLACLTGVFAMLALVMKGFTYAGRGADWLIHRGSSDVGKTMYTDANAFEKVATNKALADIETYDAKQ